MRNRQDGQPVAVQSVDEFEDVVAGRCQAPRGLLRLADQVDDQVEQLVVGAGERADFVVGRQSDLVTDVALARRLDAFDDLGERIERAARDEELDDRPRHEDEHAEAHDSPGPALQHNGYLPIPGALRCSTVEG